MRPSRLVYLFPALALTAALGACKPEAQPATSAPPGPAAFTADLAARLATAAPDLQVTVVKDLELRVSPRGGGADDVLTIYLDNAYDELRGDPTRLGAIVDRFAKSTAETLAAKDAKVDRSRIVPVVKDPAWLAEALARGGKGDKAQVWERYNRDIVVFYAQDSESTIRYLVESDLRDLGLARSDLRALAVANLDSILPEVKLHAADGVYMITAGGTYEASLILLDAIWKSPQLAVKGDLVVAIPTRDVLLVTGSRDRAGLAQVRKMVAEAARDAPYRLTDTLFVRRSGRFEPL
jgi:uncharacterized protein YtpQ (UPF0354 family)